MARKPISFAAYFMGPGFAPEGHTNALRFATGKEATEYAIALFQRWTVPTGYEVRGTSDPVTHWWSIDARQALPISDLYPDTFWTIGVEARTAGAIGTLNAEKRTYHVTARSRDMAHDVARKLAYAEGLEHVHVYRTERTS